MHKKFDASAIEKKWQSEWEKSSIYDAGPRDESKEKEYVLVELPYPSGNLHIGHWHAFAVPDIYVRFRRMQGKQVIYPIGFDAFGLPAENAAIKRDIDPKKWTESNIAYMKDQLGSMGNAFSWDKTTSTTDPEYYRWTQWMFTKFFENNIAYRGKGTVNWCPGCNTVIANEQIVNGDECERSGDKIEKRTMPQWMIRITDYADRLIDDLDNLNWPEAIKEAQRRWIGRSAGAEISFKLSTGDSVKVFTTRPDTLCGATYMVLAPEHELVQANWAILKNQDEVGAYIEKTQKKAEKDRLDESKEKTGVCLDGITATNPANNETIPVYIADYVLASYGTGAIMAVPAHDERDFEFAKKFNLKVKAVVAPAKMTHAGALLESKSKPGKFLFQLRSKDAPTLPDQISFFGGAVESNETLSEALKRELAEELELSYETKQLKNSFFYTGEEGDKHIHITHIVDVETENLVLHEGAEILELTLDEAINHSKINSATKKFLQNYATNGGVYTEPGILIESAEFDGLTSEEAKGAIAEKVGGEMTNTYRLRDWSVGRQRYWGVPIPIVYDPEGNAHAIPEEHLPWLLPDDVDFKPTGEPPLAKSQELKDRTEKIFGVGWTPEVETLDTFVDSSWYFLRYIDNKNNESFCSKDSQKDWIPIDLYFGGAEHTTMHLLYSRFWQKALYDLGFVNDHEPYQKRINRGLILGPDGNKMSKSKGNVIDPDEQVSRVGADTVKMYLAFMGPYGEVANYPWDMGGIAGIKRFLEKVNGLSEHIQETESSEITTLLQKTTLKITSDIPEFKFNTAISSLMIFVNQAEKVGLTINSYQQFLCLIAPFAPHLAEELWHEIGHTNSIHTQTFPVANKDLIQDSEVTIGIQVNGKLRSDISIAPNAPEAEVSALVQSDPRVQKHTAGETIVKVIYVPGKIINLITTN